MNSAGDWGGDRVPKARIEMQRRVTAKRSSTKSPTTIPTIPVTAAQFYRLTLHKRFAAEFFMGSIQRTTRPLASDSSPPNLSGGRSVSC